MCYYWQTPMCTQRGGGAVLPLRTQVVSMKHATSVVTDDNNVIFGIKDILKLKNDASCAGLDPTHLLNLKS